MPYEIEWREDAIAVNFFGIFVLADALKLYNEWVSDIRFESINHNIMDFTRVDRADFSDRDLAIAAAYNKAVLEALNYRQLVSPYVISNERQEELLKRYFKLTPHNKWERKLFWSREEAEAWAREKVP